MQGSSVCQGYAYAFSYLMKHWTEMTGRDYVQGYNLYPTVVSDTHAWNIIRAASTNDANMDVTWDDPDVSDRYGNPYILYDFFGLSTNEIELIDAHAVAGSNQLTDSSGAFGSSFNYHKHEGYYLNEFNLDKLAAVLAEQYDSGTNVLTVRFEYQADFEQMADNLSYILSRIGYSDYCTYTWRDELLTFNILLYPAR